MDAREHVGLYKHFPLWIAVLRPVVLLVIVTQRLELVLREGLTTDASTTVL